MKKIDKLLHTFRDNPNELYTVVFKDGHTEQMDTFTAVCDRIQESYRNLDEFVLHGDDSVVAVEGNISRQLREMFEQLIMDAQKNRMSEISECHR